MALTAALLILPAIAPNAFGILALEYDSAIWSAGRLSVLAQAVVAE
ncbi:MAG: hypothetical protein JW832_11355 [Deltaproteobacteria bacterium]|nr:hypothetical protein [Deltaproteobacteria bacterium]